MLMQLKLLPVRQERRVGRRHIKYLTGTDVEFFTVGVRINSTWVSGRNIRSLFVMYLIAVQDSNM